MIGPTTAGIVLAGGRSRRFGSDKLAATVGDGTLLDAAVWAVAAVADPVILAVGTDDLTRRDVAIPGRRVLRVRDAEPDGGPLVGLVAGLTRALAEGATRVVVAAGDMPGLVPAVLAVLVAGLDDPAVDAVVLESDGRPRPLPLAVRPEPARLAGLDALGTGDRRLRAILERLRTRRLPESAWRVLDPAGRTLADVDVPEDLSRT